jgi:hypothetical protein
MAGAAQLRLLAYPAAAVSGISLDVMYSIQRTCITEIKQSRPAHAVIQVDPPLLTGGGDSVLTCGDGSCHSLPPPPLAEPCSLDSLVQGHKWFLKGQ